ncbi:hypothetical protein [Sphingopyxis sp. JAI108]|nr:hypothetical protein [Sphingopyxis sp. JAI108]NYF34017.1 hypothetical protein [Sphingopyxis sp. JAI108]
MTFRMPFHLADHAPVANDLGAAEAHGPDTPPRNLAKVLRKSA